MPFPPSKRATFRLQHLQRDGRDGRRVGHAQERLPRIPFTFPMILQHGPDAVLVEQCRQDGDKLHLRELAADALSRSVGPGDKGSGVGRDEGFTPGHWRWLISFIIGMCGRRRGGGRSSKPATRTPFKGIGAPGLRIGVKGLNVDVDRRMRGDYTRFVAQSEGLGMEAGGLGNEDDGSV